MKPQETKFSFVYNEIKQRILDGYILSGNSLPSSRMLCKQFHVSRYTINRVFDALREDGLIDIQPRLAPIVVSGIDTCNSSFGLIMPPLLVFASQNCELEFLPNYKIDSRNL